MLNSEALYGKVDPRSGLTDVFLAVKPGEALRVSLPLQKPSDRAGLQTEHR